MADVVQWRQKVFDQNGGFYLKGSSNNMETVTREVADIMEVESPEELRVRNEKGNRQSVISSSKAQDELRASIKSPGQVKWQTYDTGNTSIEKEMSLSDALKLKSFERMGFRSNETSKGGSYFRYQVNDATVEPLPMSTITSSEVVRSEVVAASTGDHSAQIGRDLESSDIRKRSNEVFVDASNKVQRTKSKSSTLKENMLTSTNDSTDHLDWFEAEYKRSLRVVATTNDSTQLDPKIAGEKYVPDWSIANKDTVVEPNLAKLFVYNVSTPADYLRGRIMADSKFSDLAMVNQAQSNIITSELHRRWVEAVVEKKNLELQHKQEIEKLQIHLDDVAKSKEIVAKTKVAREGTNFTTVTQENGVQIRNVDDLSESYEKQTKKYAELAADHARLLAAEKQWQEKVATLKKSLSEIQEKIIYDVEAHVKEVHSLRDTITTLEQQKRWLLTTGVQHLTHKIRTSPEMIDTVAAVSNATNLCGFVKGIQAGYHYALEAKIAMENVPDLPQNAEEKLNIAVSEFDNLRIPFVKTLAAYVESPFEEIQALLQAPTPSPNS